MQLRSTSSTLFSTRELRRLLMLYRSRELTQLRCATPNFITSSALTPKVASRDPLYMIYGARGALSPNQRTLFRAQLNRFDAFKGVSIKLSLFSTSIAQGTRAFSHLREISSLLKGSTYQRSLKLSKDSSQQSTAAFFEKEYFFQKQVPLFFNFVKTIRFSEENTRDFAPALMLPPVSWGSQTPRRANQATKYAQLGFSHSQTLFFQAAQLSAPSVFVFSSILHKIETRHKNKLAPYLKATLRL